MIPIIHIAIALLILIFLAAFIYLKTTMKTEPPTDYYSLFIIGIIWLGIGVFMMISHGEQTNIFFILGIVFAAVGFSHRKTWKKNLKKWSQLSREEQKLKVFLAIALAIMVLAGIIVLLAKQFMG
ncbi:hypothetical protein ACFL3V_05670 [Nanoarchaeota archaeon]